MSSGYSGTPLVKKLGFKSQFRVHFRNAPEDYQDWVQPLPEDVKVVSRLIGDFDLIHYFTKLRRQFEADTLRLMGHLNPNGMLWVSWPKKASKVPTDMTEDIIRTIALPLGLVDVKVCAVNEVWSGLKLVIRKELRKC